MDALIHVRSTTSDATIRAILAGLPSPTNRSYLSKFAKLRKLIDSSQHATCSVTAVILGDVHIVSRWLHQSAGKDHVSDYIQAIEVVLAILKHAYPTLPSGVRESYQKAWRQVYAAARELFEQCSLAAKEQAAKLHAVKLKAISAGLNALPPGDQDRCIVMILLRLAGRLSDDLIHRLGNLKVYDSRDCETLTKVGPPDDSLVEDFVFLCPHPDQSYLAYRNAAAEEGGAATQIRAMLPEAIAAEIKASIDLRPRTHLFVQRGGHAYTLIPSFQKRMRSAVKATLLAAGQAAVSLQDVLAIARSEDADIINQISSL